MTASLRAIRGRSGGLKLARPVQEIRLGEVVRATEPDLTLVECFAAGSPCVITRCCKLAKVLDEAPDAFFDILDQHTLAEIALRPKDFTEFLGPAPSVAASVTTPAG